MAARDERGQRDAAPRAAVEPRPGPDLAPGVAGDQILEVRGELGRACDRSVDVLVAEHGAAHLHASLVGFAHRVSSVRWASTCCVNADGCSAFAM